ncbi:MAG TPA: phospho-sugar mutase [Jiangellaceae bacterium]
MTDVLDAARAWVDDDPDPATRAELTALITKAESGEAAARDDIADRFAGRLEFGTAGLRGALGAGPNRMNRAVVIRTAAGLAAYLGERGGTSVVVGYDARHMSAEFARDTCAVMAGAGISAALLPRPLPTPVLAFAIRHLGTDAGVMVTASHNPPQDNGYKVYLGDGSQIAPPADTDISAQIDAVPSAGSVPLATSGWSTLGEDVIDAYVERAASVARPGGPREVTAVYTPLHGVGAEVIERAITAAGFAAPEPVSEQASPDPDFPTVAFPNPEEPGAIDLAVELAADRNADLVLANDPDADRCAVAAPMADGGWRMLRGDEVGGLLAAHLAEREPGLTGTFACSIVSSSLLGKIAAAYGLGYQETLTGFKWISRVDDLRFGYEEALGYCVDPDAVRDKDGISAAVLVLELAATLRAAGRTLADALDDLARGYGLHATDQLSVRVDDLSQISTAMERLRSDPPTELGGRAVSSVEDLSEGTSELPPTDGLRYYLAEGARIVVRPSGTEPKLKCYLEVVVQTDGDVAGARALAADQLAALKSDLAAAAGL